MTIPLWRQILRNNFTNWSKLADFLQLKPFQREIIDKNPHFPLNLPLRLAEKITKKTLDDPILKQFLPTVEENKKHAHFVEDPVGDNKVLNERKLLKKYSGRVLILATSACVMNCRFCFRQNFDYETTRKSYTEELKLIASDPSIKEVILSGGDPLALSNNALKELFHELDAIPHVKRIRLHTRLPLGIPERIDEGFVHLLGHAKKQVWLALHINHVKELDETVLAHLNLLQRIGIPILTQTVLLKGINDSVSALKMLFENLVDHGIMPYYLHQLDRVKGTQHFEVSEEKGKKLIHQLTRELSGYAVPKYVKEIPGEASKTPI